MGKQDLFLEQSMYFCSNVLRVSLVPVVSFGENELYRRLNFFNLLPNGISWGRSFFGYIPLRRPVVTVGKQNISLEYFQYS